MIASKFPEHVRLSELLPEDTPMPRLVAALDEHGLEGSSSSERGDPYFDALIVGEKNREQLHYKEKVRFGFDDEKKRDLLGRMDELRAAECPLTIFQKSRAGAHWMPNR